MRLSRLLRLSSSRARDLEVLSTGDPQRVAKRAANKMIGRAVGKAARRLFLR